MRQAIETAPRDGTMVTLEDDGSGTYVVAHWSAEAGRWVGENGEPSEITPTHWYQRHGDYRYFLQEDERQPRRRRPRRFAVFPIVAVSFLLIGFMGLYFFRTLCILRSSTQKLSCRYRNCRRPTCHFGSGLRPIRPRSRQERRSNRLLKRPLGNCDNL